MTPAPTTDIPNGGEGRESGSQSVGTPLDESKVAEYERLILDSPPDAIRRIHARSILDDRRTEFVLALLRVTNSDRPATA